MASLPHRKDERVRGRTSRIPGKLRQVVSFVRSGHAVVKPTAIKKGADQDHADKDTETGRDLQGLLKFQQDTDRTPLQWLRVSTVDNFVLSCYHEQNASWRKKLSGRKGFFASVSKRDTFDYKYDATAKPARIDGYFCRGLNPMLTGSRCRPRHSAQPAPLRPGRPRSSSKRSAPHTR